MILTQIYFSFWGNAQLTCWQQLSCPVWIFNSRLDFLGVFFCFIGLFFLFCLGFFFFNCALNCLVFMPLFLPISAQHLLFQFWGSEGQHSWPVVLVAPSCDGAWSIIICCLLVLIFFLSIEWHTVANLQELNSFSNDFICFIKCCWYALRVNALYRPWHLVGVELVLEKAPALPEPGHTRGCEGQHQALLPESDSLLVVNRCSLMCYLISLREWRTVHPLSTLGYVLPVHSRSILLRYL